MTQMRPAQQGVPPCGWVEIWEKRSSISGCWGGFCGNVGGLDQGRQHPVLTCASLQEKMGPFFLLLGPR